MSSSTFAPKPIFGLEIEIFVKVKPKVAKQIKEKRAARNNRLPSYWQTWDFNLSNKKTLDEELYTAQNQQRKRVKQALTDNIKAALGKGAEGWKCVGDSSLEEHQLVIPPEPRSWWGVEIISPPMATTRKWQSELRELFDEIGQDFDLWTHPVTSCHVHVSPGPTDKNEYTAEHLTRIAKGAFFWEEAFKALLPDDRRNNTDYAAPNYTMFATQEYLEVRQKTWRPVFDAIDQEMEKFKFHGDAKKTCFCIKMMGAEIDQVNAKYRPERYASTNFLPFIRIKTIELRRQGGVASAKTAIYRALVAVTLHVSARRFKFDKAATRNDYPAVAELIKELGSCMQKLPDTSQNKNFVEWLEQCVKDHSGSGMSEIQVNRRERRQQDSKNPWSNEDLGIVVQPAALARSSGGARPSTSASRQSAQTYDTVTVVPSTRRTQPSQPSNTVTVNPSQRRDAPGTRPAPGPVAYSQGYNTVEVAPAQGYTRTLPGQVAYSNLPRTSGSNSRGAQDHIVVYYEE